MADAVAPAEVSAGSVELVAKEVDARTAYIDQLKREAAGAWPLRGQATRSARVWNLRRDRLGLLRLMPRCSLRPPSAPALSRHTPPAVYPQQPDVEVKYDFSYDLHVPSSQVRRLSLKVPAGGRRAIGARNAAMRPWATPCFAVGVAPAPRRQRCGPGGRDAALSLRRRFPGSERCALLTRPLVQVDHEIPTTTGKFRDLLLTPVSVAKEVARIARRQPDDSTRAVSILKDCKGALLPGTMTLLVAPPGHGKTSFLKALAGRLPAGSLSGRCGPRPRQRGFRGASAALAHRVAPARPALAR